MAFKKLFATKLEDAFPMMPMHPTEEILDLEMEAEEHAPPPSLSHFI
jgi:hypothetical protein